MTECISNVFGYSGTAQVAERSIGEMTHHLLTTLLPAFTITNFLWSVARAFAYTGKAAPLR